MQEDIENREEQLWFTNVKRKLSRRIANPKWDCLSLTKIEWDTILFITNAKNVNELPILINERVTDSLFSKIDNQFKQIKGKTI